MSDPELLIKGWSHELIEDHHHPGSGRYGLAVKLVDDISSAFPYLNAVLEDTIYDHQNGILIGASGGKRYAFRAHDIQMGMVPDPAEAPALIEEVVSLVNRVWAERSSITPSYGERKKPPVYEIFRLLPGGNCRQCGYPTCLAFAADLRNGVVALDICPPLDLPEHAEKKARILALFVSG